MQLADEKLFIGLGQNITGDLFVNFDFWNVAVLEDLDEVQHLCLFYINKATMSQFSGFKKNWDILRLADEKIIICLGQNITGDLFGKFDF